MAVFNPALFQNLPQGTTGQEAQPLPVEPLAPVTPMATPEVPAPVQPSPTPIPNPIFIPVPIKIKEPVKNKINISPEAARKAQGIYPQEKQDKQLRIENAKAPPTPTGAWGAPE